MTEPGHAGVHAAKQQLRPRIVELRQQLIDEQVWAGVEFFREVLEELDRAESEFDLQGLFTLHLGVSGPLAKAAGFSAPAIAMLDGILETAEEIALTFSVGIDHPQ